MNVRFLSSSGGEESDEELAAASSQAARGPAIFVIGQILGGKKLTFRARGQTS
jgi:hypothetical protein